MLCMDGSPLLAAGGGASLSPTSPVSVRSNIGLNGGAKRKRSAGAPGSIVDSSPGSVLNDDDAEHGEKKRLPGVKRACNECRQQKVINANSRHFVLPHIQKLTCLE